MSNRLYAETMADKLGLGPEVHELKLGSSFSSPGTGFHTLRYDFKPASMDARRSAMLDVGSTNEVMVSVPHGDGGGQSVFKGPRKPYQKECVLILDRRTGEIVLERLSNNINVKKTRMEKLDRIDRLESSSARLAPPRPVTPVDGPGRRPSPSVSRHSPLQTSPGRSPSSTSGQKPSPGHFTRSPGPNPSAPSVGGLPPSVGGLAPSVGGLSSLPIIGHENPEPAISSTHLEGMPAILPDSSSESDSSNSSGSSESDSDSDREMAKKKTDSVLMSGQSANNSSQLNGVSAMSMPSHLLSEDLQLSESGSDFD